MKDRDEESSLEEQEDLADLRDMDEVLAAGEKPVPWEEVKASLGVKQDVDR